MQYEEPLCAQVGSSIFFPDKEDNPVDASYAKSICAKCKHQTECAEWAIENLEMFGIWGGLAPRQRQIIRAKRERLAKSR